MKNKILLKLILFILISTFLSAYLIEKSGYYEYNLQNHKNLTEKQIKQFEKDVKEGKDIDINNYLTNTTTNYSNTLTKTTTDLSLKFNNYLKTFLTNSLKVLEKFIK